MFKSKNKITFLMSFFGSFFSCVMDQARYPEEVHMVISDDSLSENEKEKLILECMYKNGIPANGQKKNNNDIYISKKLYDLIAPFVVTKDRIDYSLVLPSQEDGIPIFKDKTKYLLDVFNPTNEKEEETTKKIYFKMYEAGMTSHIFYFYATLVRHVFKISQMLKIATPEEAIVLEVAKEVLIQAIDNPIEIFIKDWNEINKMKDLIDAHDKHVEPIREYMHEIGWIGEFPKFPTDKVVAKVQNTSGSSSSSSTGIKAVSMQISNPSRQLSTAAGASSSSSDKPVPNSAQTSSSLANSKAKSSAKPKAQPTAVSSKPKAQQPSIALAAPKSNPKPPISVPAVIAKSKAKPGPLAVPAKPGPLVAPKANPQPISAPTGFEVAPKAKPAARNQNAWNQQSHGSSWNSWGYNSSWHSWE